ncbi:MAG: bifunctional phosphoribosylaminoimidazolecarboxamide formyltransferase/IMP cyclohydrolase [Gemmatimonadaceae bacterium]
MRALLSVSDKSGLVPFARGLAAAGVELVSTGGTARTLRDGGLTVKDVSDLTGFPEMLDGRVKTLHPVVHGGLLARRDLPEHMAAIEAHHIGLIDLVVVNLYPFRETAAKPGVHPDEVIENIDIGGPSMLRSAAKNFPAVWVVVDPNDYTQVLAHVEAGTDDAALRRLLAEKVYAHTSAYDAAIATWFAQQRGEPFPDSYPLAFEKQQVLRYGENPQQRAAFYVERPGAGLGALVQKGGKDLSFNNLLDLEGALLAIEPFGEQPACAIIKHTTPSGLATGSTAHDAYKKALACDPV